ncbi:MAG: 3-dehydroquinate synthase [Pseudomonadota bacterium]
MSDARHTKLDVALGGRSYPILIGSGLAAGAGRYIQAPAGGRPQVIVTDEEVAARHVDTLVAGLDRAVNTIVLPAGEATKSWAELERLCERLLALGVERGDAILAFGGGVIGDLAGFAASILRRGCRVVQIPTTLLAQVDSSVGGKTAINTAGGKNLIGAFHQPDLVLIDTDLLATLPARQLRAGYAEIVKYGLIGDAAFFAWCEANGTALLAGNANIQTHAIAQSCRAKAAVVAADERETEDRRALLNLGHTFGHALEAEGGYSDKLLHGEAVAIGMALAFRYSARRGLCAAADAVRVAAHLESVELPVALPPFARAPDRLIGHMRQDKKAVAGRVPLILARGIGAAFVAHDIDLDDVRAFLATEAGA